MSASIADDLIRSYFDRWQRLEEEKRTISDDLKELFAEARGNGLDTKALRAVFREQVGDKTARDEFDAICDLYRASLERPRARPAHSAREIIEEFDAKTGEITEHEQPETATQSGPGSDEAEDLDAAVSIGSLPAARLASVESDMPAASPLPARGVDESAGPISNPQSSPLSGADKPEAVSPPITPAVSGAYSKPLNPDCRKAARGEQCALMHSQALCSKCRQAVFDRKVAA